MTTDHYLFADALLLACARALRLVGPDEASGIAAICWEVAPVAEDDVALPFGCVRYAPNGREPKIVPQLYVAGRKIGLGHFPYTQAGAEQASRARAAAVAVKQAGGDLDAVKQAAREA